MQSGSGVWRSGIRNIFDAAGNAPNSRYKSDMEPTLHSDLYLALILTPGLGPNRTHKLIKRFGGIEEVFRASLTELEAAFIPAESAQSIALGRSKELADAEM